jgi:hypothetical protein
MSPGNAIDAITHVIVSDPQHFDETHPQVAHHDAEEADREARESERRKPDRSGSSDAAALYSPRDAASYRGVHGAERQHHHGIDPDAAVLERLANLARRNLVAPANGVKQRRHARVSRAAVFAGALEMSRPMSAAGIRMPYGQVFRGQRVVA